MMATAGPAAAAASSRIVSGTTASASSRRGAPPSRRAAFSGRAGVAPHPGARVGRDTSRCVLRRASRVRRPPSRLRDARRPLARAQTRRPANPTRRTGRVAALARTAGVPNATLTNRSSASLSARSQLRRRSLRCRAVRSSSPSKRGDKAQLTTGADGRGKTVAPSAVSPPDAEVGAYSPSTTHPPAPPLFPRAGRTPPLLAPGRDASDQQASPPRACLPSNPAPRRPRASHRARGRALPHARLASPPRPARAPSPPPAPPPPRAPRVLHPAHPALTAVWPPRPPSFFFLTRRFQPLGRRRRVRPRRPLRGALREGRRAPGGARGDA